MQITPLKGGQLLYIFVFKLWRQTHIQHYTCRFIQNCRLIQNILYLSISYKYRHTSCCGLMIQPPGTNQKTLSGMASDPSVFPGPTCSAQTDNIDNWWHITSSEFYRMLYSEIPSYAKTKQGNISTAETPRQGPCRQWVKINLKSPYSVTPMWYLQFNYLQRITKTVDWAFCPECVCTLQSIKGSFKHLQLYKCI